MSRGYRKNFFASGNSGIWSCTVRGVGTTTKGEAVNDKARAVAEGTEITESGVAVLTGEAIDHYRFSALILAYVTEIRTGMKVSRIPLSRVAESYGVTARNKKTALRALLALYAETYGREFKDGRLADIL